ncbi:hypothetical protein GPECTOR_141g700 [Gonium pectorale]|uniref:Uncharacterized protein n=1 Tax=Gonium pectorale TaxID=33097 RepID=A0A150FY08_GONPE|nr:hypothetical protein GPECTOR_141g700 [Gonium pectorale]|eukprot:KXZ42502.1 hypothetical protein GPECTOR_141g700 [Gonium pectorale]
MTLVKFAHHACRSKAWKKRVTVFEVDGVHVDGRSTGMEAVNGALSSGAPGAEAAPAQDQGNVELVVRCNMLTGWLALGPPPGPLDRLRVSVHDEDGQRDVTLTELEEAAGCTKKKWRQTVFVESVNGEGYASEAEQPLLNKWLLDRGYAFIGSVR